jgi:endoglycosylceramidase
MMRRWLRRWVRVTVSALAALLLTLALTAAGPNAGPLESYGHAGRWITDDAGRVLVFHGVNMVNKLPPYDPASLGFADDDVALLAREGVNAVRVGVLWVGVEPAPGEYDDAYLDSIASTVNLLHASGIAALLDFHQDGYGVAFNGDGFPAWATLTDDLPIEPLKAFPLDYARNASLQRAFDNFWANRLGPGGIGLQDRYAAAWAHVAARFRDVPGLLGYELMNEPFPGSDWKACSGANGCPGLDADRLAPFSRRMLDAIRGADASHLVWYEPWVLFDAGAETHVGPLGDAGAGMSFHDYDNSDFDRPLGNAERQSQRTGDALLMTEFGATTDPAVVRNGMAAADRAMSSPVYWAYANNAPFPIPPGVGVASPREQGLVLDPSQPLVGANLHNTIWDAFVRPYPRAVAGTPVRWSYDPSGRIFDLAYSTAPADGGVLAGDLETEVFVPGRHYPAGYRVTVTNGRVVSPLNDPVLRVVGDPGASEITIHVTP